ncbi:MAG: MAPEG family protein [Mesorhizobium sp.]|nr:MAPEG family protein [Mesorhizobium sp.]
MNSTAIFWPMIVQAALIYAIYVLVSRRRVAAIKAGNAKTSQFRENQNEPAESLFARNNLANQFELPVLFFAVVLALHATAAVNYITVALAWIFVVSRCIHAYLHVTTNRIRYRRPAFIVGYFAVGLLWIWLALHIAGLA